MDVVYQLLISEYQPIDVVYEHEYVVYLLLYVVDEILLVVVH